MHRKISQIRSSKEYSFIQLTVVNKTDRVVCPRTSIHTYIIHCVSTLFMDIGVSIAYMNFLIYMYEVNMHCFYNKNNNQ